MLPQPSLQSLFSIINCGSPPTRSLKMRFVSKVFAPRHLSQVGHLRRSCRRIVIAGVLSIMMVSAASAQKGVLPLGTPMPLVSKQIKLVDGSTTTLANLKGTQSTVIVFWSNKCPWCSKVETRLSRFVASVDAAAVPVILVNSNDAAAFPGEGAAESAQLAAKLKVKYVSDLDGSLMEAFGASRAPTFFVFDKDNTLIYLGSFDDSPGDEGNVEATYVADAVKAIREAKSISVSDTKAFGCLIKPKQ